MTIKQPLAIIGIGCRFPGGITDLDSYWRLLIDRRSGITEVPAERWNWHKYYHPNAEIPNRMVTKWGGFVDHADQFDAQFFGISPRELGQMDVQQRWLLETSWEAMENAGVPASGLRGSKVGVFVGISSHDHIDALRGDLAQIDIHSGTGNALSIAANRISFMFDFKGPSMAVDTACSSALVAVQLACQSIWSGDSTLALAGGVNAIINPNMSIMFSRASMLSPTGTCFAFDHRANGYVRSEGVGVVLIKPLEQAIADGDHIHAVIRAAVVNQDGHSSSLTIPEMASQEAMLREAYQQAGIDTRHVSYIEAHGTGTPVGDPIEALAIGHVMGKNRPADDPCLIGSVKTNIGHLESASGMAGLIKACLILQHQIIPPHLNFEKVNPHSRIDENGLRVVADQHPLPLHDGHPVIVGVNSFGFGGTNAHVVLEQAPLIPAAAASPRTALRPYVLPISAADEPSLRVQAESYLSHLRSADRSLSEIAAAAGHRRDHLHQRLVVIGEDTDSLRARLLDYLNHADSFTGNPAAEPRDPVFVFTGQGAQWWGMGQQLVAREPIFRQTLERIDALLHPLLGTSLIAEMLRDEQHSRIDDTDIAQPAIFALQVALAELWASWGIRPAKVIGHSVGEVAAAYVAGIYSLEDAVTIIYHRSRLQHQTGGHGAMIAVGVSISEAEAAINSHHNVVQLAAANSPSMVTLSGEISAVEALAAQFEEAGKFVRRLPISYAFHSYQMDVIHSELLDSLSAIQPMQGTLPFISTVTGGEIAGEDMTAEYWWRNVRQPVRFAEAISTLIASGDTTFLELGPHPALEHPLRDCLSDSGASGHVFHSLRREADESLEMLSNFAAQHIYGLPVDWAAVNQSDHHYVNLPTYQWQHQPYMLESKVRNFYDIEPFDHPLLGMRINAPNPTWQLELDPRVLGWLNDHKLWDNIVFPAAGYAEMALAVGAILFPNEPYALEALEMKKAMFVSTNNLPTLQIVFDASDKSVSIYSAIGDKDEWQLHAQGYLRVLAAAVPQPVDLDALRQSLVYLGEGEAFYQVSHSMGYQWGADFQQISKIWAVPTHSLVEVIVTDAVREQAVEYHFHPALLDACGQTFSAAGEFEKWLRRGEIIPFLPAEFGRIRLYTDALPPRFWIDTRITSETEQAVTGTATLYDDDGTLLAEVVDFRFDRVIQKAAATDTARFYQFQWKRQRLKGVALEALTLSLPALPTPDLGGDYRQFVAELDAITVRLIETTLLDLGWDFPDGHVFSLDAMLLHLGIIDRYRSLVQTHLHALTAVGMLASEGSDHWRVMRQPAAADVASMLDAALQDYPEHASEIALIRALVSPNLAHMLRGRIDPAARFAVDGVLSAYHRTGSEQVAMQQQVQAVISGVLADLPADRPLRLLQIGAGALSAAILPLLPDHTEYTLTALTSKALAEARQQFSDYPFVEFHTFDLADEPAVQGLDPQGYDLVLIANARAHAADHLDHIADCIAPDGLLILWADESARLALTTVFGLLDGITHEAHWDQRLSEAGFRDFVAADAGLPLVIARAPERSIVPPAAAAPASVLIFADQQGMAASLRDSLQAAGTRVISVTTGDAFAALDAETYQIDATQEADLSALFAAIDDDQAPLTAIIHAWGLDHPNADGLSSDQLLLTQQTGVLHALRLAHALDAAKLARPPQVIFLSRSTQNVIDGDPVDALPNAPLIGFMRVANNEMPAYHWRVIDLDATPDADEAQTILDEIALADGELEIAYRSGRRYVNRLRHVKPDALPTIQHPVSSRAFRLQFEKSGALGNLSLNETTRRAPQPDEVEVQVQAGGINFRDVMKVLGMYPGNPVDLTWLGDDFAGTVINAGEQTAYRSGDQVVGLSPYAFRSHLTIDQRAVFKKPAHLSFEEAAALPTVFLTAYYALIHLARMRAGESILIHAGTGGVGQAAIQIAQDIGLEIIATAGSPEKRALLHDQGITHVFNSRTLDFADDVMRVTQGRGVDAVLNSLAGDFIPKNFSVLAPFGRYLEIGKIDVYNNSKIGLEALRNNIAVYIIDLAQLMQHRPHEFAAMHGDLRGKFEAGTYRPIPHRTFPITEAVDAFRYMASGKHIGKNILSFDVPDLTIGTITEDGALFRADASYLITGGAGGVGLEVANWMAQQGARHLVLMSRSGPPDDAAHATIAALRESGIEVIDARGDVTVQADVQRIVDDVQNSKFPLAGVIHGAMVLHDTIIGSMTEDLFNVAFRPKMLGAWNLHAATLAIPLDHFICFSSISSIIGTGGQANYSAGNAFLDALASYRRARGLPALTINWGVIGGTGVVARNTEAGRYLDSVGVKAISIPAMLGYLRTMLAVDVPQVCIASVDWTNISRYLMWVANSGVFDALTRQENTGADSDITAQIIAAQPADRQGLVETYLSRMVAKVLNTPVDQIDRELSLTYFGLDSLMTLELINSISTQLNLTLTVSDVLSSATIRDVAAIIVQRVMANSDVAGDAEPVVSSIDLYAEAQLAPDIHVNGAVAAVSVPSTILLTGATGFLGAFLLADLLRHTDAEVQCLVRAADPDDGMRRLRENLSRFGLWNDQDEARILPVVGDLALPAFGLPAAQYEALASQIDAIYHNGAWLNLILPYESLKPINVGGVEEVLRLACHTRIKPVHYISTIAVFFALDATLQRIVRESDHADPAGLLGGYTQTKWVAEQLVRQAHERGIPCTIYRPGVITGDSQTGATNTEDLASRMIKGSYQLGMYPDRNMTVNVVPVDYVSRGIVHLASLPDVVGQVFHLTNPQSTPLNDIVSWTSASEAVREVTYREWRAALTQQAQQRIENDLLPLLPLFPIDRPELIDQQIDCQRTAGILAHAGITCPPIDARLVDVYAAYLASSGYLEAAR